MLLLLYIDIYLGDNGITFVYVTEHGLCTPIKNDIYLAKIMPHFHTGSCRPTITNCYKSTVQFYVENKHGTSIRLYLVKNFQVSV